MMARDLMKIIFEANAARERGSVVEMSADEAEALARLAFLGLQLDKRRRAEIKKGHQPSPNSDPI